MDVQNKHVLVVGLARSGLAVAHALARRGAVVTVTDRKPPAEFRDVLPQLFKDKVGVELGSQRVETFLRHQIIVTSPGVPWDMPQLKAARERGIPIYPEVEAASWFLEGTLVGITGSNGKTTTTSLLGDMLKASGFPTFVGGNIGSALSSAVDHAKPGTRFVTELSSFQLEGIHEFRPHVAVMLNLSPNHLDRHPNLEAYSQAKRQIFRNQGGQDYAVLNADDPWVAGLQAGLSGQPVLFSRHRELPNGVFVSGGKIYYRVRHLERVLFETRDVTLKGDFNLEDVLAATAAACVLGADFTAIRKAVRAFHAVEHRLEFVSKIEEVDFYNNSKATSVDATVKSLEAFDRGVHLIMGGKDKGAPYAPLRPRMKDRVREVLLIGAAAPVIAEQLAGSVELVQAGDLSTAVTHAFTRSRPGDTVLLAPACSSFDQFEDYEERGRVFKDLVKRLAKDVSAGRVVRIPNSEFRIPNSEFRIPESEVRSPESEVRSPESGVRGFESGISNLESGIRDSESGISDSTPTKSATPEPPIPTPEPRVVPTPEPLTPSPESRAPSSESHVPLTYVYEVDAVDMPELESQVLPEDEPVVSASAKAEEILDDEVLPFEARPAKGKSEVRSPESEVQSTQPEARNLESGIGNLESGIRNSESGISEPAPTKSANSEPPTPSPKSGVQSTQSEVRGPESEVRSPGSEVRSSESEAQPAEPEAPPTPKQPKLFNGNDK